MPKKQHLLLSGVLVLTLSNLLVKAVGLLYKIPLQGILSDEGMGYFNAAYALYTWFYTLATAGIPVAVSILISKSHAEGREQNKRRLFSVTMALMLFLGTVLFLLMYFCADVLARMIDSPATAPALAAIAPTVFFVCLSGGIRGYFQGLGNLMPTALSQLAEAAGKLGLGIWFAKRAAEIGMSLPQVAASAVMGLSVGSAVGTLLLAVWYLAHRAALRKEKHPISDTPVAYRCALRSIFVIAIPITLSASVLSLSSLSDVALVIRRLRDAGWTQELSMAMYGNYTTLALPMFHLTPVLTTPIAYAVLPALTAARARGEREGADILRHTAMKTTVLIALPCTVGLSVFAEPILSLFFAQPSVAMAAPLLSVLALATPLVCLCTLTATLLQAEGKERATIWSMVCGVAVKLAALYLLVGIPTVGIYGSAISTFLCYFTILAANLIFLQRGEGSLPSVVTLTAKPFAAATVSVLVARMGHLALSAYLPAPIVTLISLALAAILYLVAVLALRALGAKELGLLPWGERLIRLFQRLGLLSKEANDTDTMIKEGK